MKMFVYFVLLCIFSFHENIDFNNTNLFIIEVGNIISFYACVGIGVNEIMYV